MSMAVSRASSSNDGFLEDCKATGLWVPPEGSTASSDEPESASPSELLPVDHTNANMTCINIKTLHRVDDGINIPWIIFGRVAIIYAVSKIIFDWIYMPADQNLTLHAVWNSCLPIQKSENPKISMHFHNFLVSKLTTLSWNFHRMVVKRKHTHRTSFANMTTVVPRPCNKQNWNVGG